MREIKQTLDANTVKKALQCCSQNECQPECPFYKYGGLVCNDVASVMESALAIILKQEKAIIESAKAVNV